MQMNVVYGKDMFDRNLDKEEKERKDFSFTMGGKSDYLRFDESVWRRVTKRMVELGMNYVMIDLGEGLVYPSHPEISVKGSWDGIMREFDLG
jgi:beta-galactosidase GanA